MNRLSDSLNSAKAANGPRWRSTGAVASAAIHASATRSAADSPVRSTKEIGHSIDGSTTCHGPSSSSVIREWRVSASVTTSRNTARKRAGSTTPVMSTRSAMW